MRITCGAAEGLPPLSRKDRMYPIQHRPATRPSPGVDLDESIIALVCFVQSKPDICRQWLKQMIEYGIYFYIDVDDLTLAECHEAVWDIAEAVWASNNKEKLN